MTKNDLNTVPSRLQRVDDKQFRFTHPRYHAVLGWIGQNNNYEPLDFNSVVEALEYVENLRDVVVNAIPKNPLDDPSFARAFEADENITEVRRWIVDHLDEIQAFQRNKAL